MAQRALRWRAVFCMGLGSLGSTKQHACLVTTHKRQSKTIAFKQAVQSLQMSACRQADGRGRHCDAATSFSSTYLPSCCRIRAQRELKEMKPS